MNNYVYLHSYLLLEININFTMTRVLILAKYFLSDNIYNISYQHEPEYNLLFVFDFYSIV